MKRLILKVSAPILILSLFVPHLFLALPQKTEASATAASCAAAFTASAAVAAPGAAQEVIAVPKANASDFFGGIFSGGSVNVQSINTCILKPLGTMIVIALIRNIGASVVDWVNTGFNGSPSFVTDFAGTLTDAADQAVGKFIEGSELGWLCNDFSFQIRIVLALKYSKPFKERVTCTLSGIGDNITNFANNNSGRGWDNWLQITTQPSNNIYGAYLIADSELARRALQGVDEKYKRIAIGGGFLDSETCTRYETTPEVNARLSTVKKDSGGTPLSGGAFSTQVTKTNITYDANGHVQQNNVVSTEKAAADGIQPQCLEKSVSTPGQTIAHHLDSVLGQGEIQSAVAQEIDQVIGATLNQIAQKALMGARGLLGSSKKSSSGSSYISKYQNAYYYGSTTVATADTGATSPTDAYRVVDYNDASALLNDPNNSGLQEINKLVETTSNTASKQQLEQIDSLVENSEPTTNLKNAALSKSATISSGSRPGGANDGIRTTSNYAQGATTATNDANAWWEVDLGQPANVQEVRVWKVDGDGTKTLGNFRVLVSNDRTNPWRSPTIDGSVLTAPLVVPINQTGRYVRIEKDAKTYACGNRGRSTCYYPLELAEVEVMTQIITPKTSTTAGTSTSNSTASVPQTTALTIQAPTDTQPMTYLQSLVTSVPILATPSTLIPLLEINLLSNGTPIKFDTIFGEPVISIRNTGQTNNYSMDSVGTFGLKNVTAGTANGTKVILTGQVLSFTKGNSYQLRIVAKDSAGATISTGTVDFVVQ